MQIATKVITGLGAILTVVALGWLLTGAFDYFRKKKSEPTTDGSRYDFYDFRWCFDCANSRDYSSHCISFRSYLVLKYIILRYFKEDNR